MWNMPNISLLFFCISVTDATIVGFAKLDGGSRMEIRQDTIDDPHITVVGNVNFQGDGEFLVQLMKLPDGGCNELDRLEELELLVVLAEAETVYGIW